jgi:CHAT domain-containing protein
MRLHSQRPNEGYAARGLQASERARARSLLETLAESKADLRQGVDIKLLDSERALQNQLNVKAEEQTRLLSGNHTQAQAEAIAKEIDAFTGKLQQIEAQIRRSSPRYAALTQPQPLTPKEIQSQLLDSNTMLLEYWLGDAKSYLWAVTQTSITSFELPKREEIESAAREFYALLTTRPKSLSAGGSKKRGLRVPTGRQANLKFEEVPLRLSRTLLGPVRGQLGNKRLLIVNTGALQFIPFTALPSPTTEVGISQPLVSRHEIVNLPSASTLAVLRRELGQYQRATKGIVVLADPVFERTDSRVKLRVRGNTQDRTASAAKTEERAELALEVTRAAEETGVARDGLFIPRLPGTRREAEQILSMVSADEGKGAFDFAASRLTATSLELSQYRFVHFATHGFLNSVHPELSGIVLSLFDEEGNPQDGFMRAHEVFKLKLGAELVVLSACQTGLGKEVKGEGLVGLTRGFMYAGAPRVVVSLWNVSDEATAELMTRFYRGMLRKGLAPAAALRSAQVSLMKERKWSAPFYWAAFTLQGEWR